MLFILVILITVRLPREPVLPATEASLLVRILPHDGNELITLWDLKRSIRVSLLNALLSVLATRVRSDGGGVRLGCHSKLLRSQIHRVLLTGDQVVGDLESSGEVVGGREHDRLRLAWLGEVGVPLQSEIFPVFYCLGTAAFRLTVEGNSIVLVSVGYLS